jgi:two-component system chemotaxis response regulator CheB
VSYLFRSVAEVLGRNAVGVLLSGMGRDGASEMKMLAERGAVTIAQDPQTTVVAGMPGEAIKLGAALYVLAPEKIIKVLQQLMAPLIVESR